MQGQAGHLPSCLSIAACSSARGTCPESQFHVAQVRALAVKVYMLVYGRVGSAAQKHLPEDLNPKIREQLQVQSHSPAIRQSQFKAESCLWPLVLLAL